MTLQKLASAIEAVVFANGDAVEIKKLCDIFEVKAAEINKAISIIENRFNREESGVWFLRLGDSVQFASSSDYGEYVRAALDLRRRAPLSPAGFEVLAVVAYNQPVTKSFIEQVRGVDCSGVITTLCEKELIEEKGRLELPGRPLLYGTTDNFLRCFSLKSLDDLPPLPEREDITLADRQLELPKEEALEPEEATESEEIIEGAITE